MPSVISKFNNAARTIIGFVFILLHLGFGLFLNLGHFPWACISIWLSTLPSSFWDFISSRLKPSSIFVVVAPPPGAPASVLVAAVATVLGYGDDGFLLVGPADVSSVRASELPFGVRADGALLCGPDAVAAIVAKAPALFLCRPLLKGRLLEFISKALHFIVRRFSSVERRDCVNEDVSYFKSLTAAISKSGYHRKNTLFSRTRFLFNVWFFLTGPFRRDRLTS